MKYSYSWLKELSGTKKSPEKVVEDLTMHSFEVEGMEIIGSDLSGVIVAEILEIRKHPDADRLRLATVTDGKNKMEVVCGAPNIEVGQKVPLAKVGTVLPGGIEIRPAEIRGVKSNGMLCAEDELGLGKDHSGIIILDKNAKVGKSVKKYLGVSDTVIEIKVLPDRAHDALSHVGVAREIAVLENKRLDYDFEGLVLPKIKSKKLKVEIKDKDLCYRYIGAVLGNITIKESPKWMKERLEASGIRAINNVVDATNYIMLELGNPLHAFDFERIKTADTKAEIVVRRAKKGEKMKLLDDTALTLSENDLLITNGRTPLALAGIMGGYDSGIEGNTKTIVLESATFNPINIRRSRTRLGLKTESSDRFEKGIDPNLAQKAMVRIIEILEHTAGASLEGIADAYPKPVKSWKIKLNLEYVERLLGEKIPSGSIIKILNLLGIKTKLGKLVECEIPTFRIDLATQEDLIEEIGRVWGYEKIEEIPLKEGVWPSEINEQVFFERHLQDIVTGIGYDEVYNYSFYGEKELSGCGLDPKNHLELANPMNPDQRFARTSLIPNILKNIHENLKYFKHFQIFEEGRVYSSGKSSTPREERKLVSARVLEKDPSSSTFFSLKGDIEDILSALNISDISFEIFSGNSFWHPARSAEIKVRGKIIGQIGEVSPQVLRKFKVRSRVAAAEIDLEILKNISSEEKIYIPLNKFPSVFRDISMIDKSGKTVVEITEKIKKAGGETVRFVELFDIYQKDGKNSYAFHIEFNAGNRTLEGKEVEDIMSKIIDKLEKELKVEIRK